VKELDVNEFSALLGSLEDRLKTFIKSEIASIIEKVDNIEKKLSCVQTECIRLGGEVESIKKIISDQQLAIESHEQKLRSNNIIVHNIPEDVVVVNIYSGQIRDDSEKIMSLCRLANIDIALDSFSSVSRLGKRLPDKTRPLKITLKHVNEKYKFFNARKTLTNDPTIKQAFKSNIYINADSSPLMRREEYRLRQKLKNLKLSNPNSSVYIRSGSLYLDGSVTDKLDVRNQFC
jgi:hypothetical protein